MKKRPAIFLDRDGTLIEEVSYLSRVEDLIVFPFAAGALASLKERGFLIVVVTNQSGIGRGIYDEATMHAIHDAIQAEVNNAIDAFYFCPHLPCDGCSCRKPLTGMLETAAADLNIDIERSWMIGDKRVDIEVGRRSGARTALVLTGYGRQHRASLEFEPDLTADDLGAAAAEIAALASAKIIV